MNKELTPLEKIEIIKSRCTTLSKNHKIGSRDIANQEVKDCVKAIEKCLEPIEKSLKALEILKRYVIDIKEYQNVYRHSYWVFFSGFEGENGDLAKEEYELLKEILINE